jgi:hypothetical protein
LSVVAQQLKSIKDALGTLQLWPFVSLLIFIDRLHRLDARLSKISFMGRSMPLDATCSYFATMNPAYVARQRLPDNLKSYFRNG